jgi:D-amino-acid oxidase
MPWAASRNAHAQPIVVVGGGAMGVTAALRLAEDGFRDVALVSDRWFNTSKTSPGIFRPDWCGATPVDRMLRWAEGTREHLARLYREAGSAAGVTTLTHLETYREAAGEAARQENAVLARVMMGFRPLTKREVELHFPGAAGGWHYSTFLVEGARYLPHLLARAERLGVRVVTRRVSGVPGSEEFCRAAARAASRPRASLFVNATGLANPDCVPARGQLVLVDAPFVKLAMGEYNSPDPKRPTYILPRRDHVVLGSTYLEGDGGRDERPETVRDVIERCAQFVPELRNAKVIATVACLRPVRRKGVRLEAERTAGGLTVVHDYGHGGAGMSLAWGCAGEVLELVRADTRARFRARSKEGGTGKTGNTDSAGALSSRL